MWSRSASERDAAVLECGGVPVTESRSTTGAVQGSGQDESAVRRVVATACEEDGVEERAVTEGPDGAPPGPTELLVAPVRRRPAGRPG
ncbi:hypothetical protein AMK14_23660 [Streptomyces sp. TSRI0445]|nr:hypothetical protein AMK14_23660 [Streptomyces sp. TSRI0445]